MSIFHFPVDTTYLAPLYHVETVASATKFTENGALVAGGTHHSRQIVSAYSAYFLQEHFNWASTSASPFISLFGREKHAKKWAAALAKKKPGTVCTVLQIDPAELSGKNVFDAQTLVANLQVMLPQSARSQVDGEFLVLHSIPARAICCIASYGRPPLPPPGPTPSQALRQGYGFAGYEDEDEEPDLDSDGLEYAGEDYVGYNYTYQDGAMDRLTARVVEMAKEELDGCGLRLRDRGRAIARLCRGVSDGL
jgi:hypothetical protein